MLRLACAVPLLVLATPALADEGREFCADRPGLGTPACTLAPGTAMIEIGAASWDHTRTAATIDDEITTGDALMRVGVTETAELQIGLTSHVTDRSRDRLTGALDRTSGIGDGTIAIRQSLSGPNGNVAIQGFVTVPISRGGEWEGGILLPSTFKLSDNLDFEVVPEVDIAANESRGGRHIAWGGVIGLTQALGDKLSLTGEFGAMRDEDPDGASTDARLAGSLAWQVADRLQFDFEADLGLTAGAPDRTLAVGLAWQFR